MILFGLQVIVLLSKFTLLSKYTQWRQREMWCTGDWERCLNKATSAKITHRASAWRLPCTCSQSVVPVLHSEEMSLISFALGARLSLHLAYLLLALTTVGILKVSSIKPDIKEICKNVKPHHSSHGSIIVIFIWNTRYLKFVLISNTVNTNRYNPYKLELFGILNHFEECKESWNKKIWEMVNYTNHAWASR